MNELDARQIREKLGLTQQRAAEIAGVTVRTWQNWEKEGRKFPADHVLWGGGVEPIPAPEPGSANDRFSAAVRYLLDRRLVRNQRDFCEKTSFTESVVSTYKSGGRGVTKEALRRLHDAFPVFSLPWLLHGHGPMLASDAAATVAGETPAAETGETTPGRLIPFYDVCSIGGRAETANTDPVSSPAGAINVGDLFRDATCAIRHYGDSMLEYPAGCVLALKEITDPALLIPGVAYVIETDDYRVTKRVQFRRDGFITALSTNKETNPDGTPVYAPFDIPLAAVRRIARVLGCIIKHS